MIETSGGTQPNPGYHRVNVDLHHLRVFRAAALSKGFTRASEVLHLSQSTVSQHIGWLEQELGCPLFLRVGRRVMLTEAGKVLLEYTEKILQELKNAEMTISEMNAVHRGTIRFGTGASTLIYHMPRVLGAYQSRYPEMELIVETGTTEMLVTGVRAQLLDLAIIMSPARRRDLTVMPLGKEELTVAVHQHHPLSGRKTLKPEECADLRFILYEQQTAMQDLMEAFFRELGIMPRVSMEMENIESIKSLVRAGLGASVLPLCAIEADVTGERLVALRVEGHSLFRELGLITLKTNRAPNAVRELSTLIRKEFRAQNSPKR